MDKVANLVSVEWPIAACILLAILNACISLGSMKEMLAVIRASIAYLVVYFMFVAFAWTKNAMFLGALVLVLVTSLTFFHINFMLNLDEDDKDDEDAFKNTAIWILIIHVAMLVWFITLSYMDSSNWAGFMSVLLIFTTLFSILIGVSMLRYKCTFAIGIQTISASIMLILEYLRLTGVETVQNPIGTSVMIGIWLIATLLAFFMPKDERCYPLPV